jgi:hypothetical protein
MNKTGQIWMLQAKDDKQNSVDVLSFQEYLHKQTLCQPEAWIAHCKKFENYEMVVPDGRSR